MNDIRDEKRNRMKINLGNWKCQKSIQLIIKVGCIISAMDLIYFQKGCMWTIRQLWSIQMGFYMDTNSRFLAIPTYGKDRQQTLSLLMM